MLCGIHTEAESRFASHLGGEKCTYSYGDYGDEFDGLIEWKNRRSMCIQIPLGEMFQGVLALGLLSRTSWATTLSTSIEG